MIINYLHKIGWFICLVLLQVLILNNVHIAGYATPFLYIYLILKFESDVSRNTLMLWAFFLGLTVDVFSDTPGMNAAATVLLAFLRPIFLRLFVPRYVGYVDSRSSHNGHLPFPKIFSNLCLGASWDVAYTRILFLCPHWNTAVESCNKYFVDCDLYNGSGGNTEEITCNR